MPRRPRIKLAGMPQHIVQRGINREPCFFAEEDYHSYLHWLEKAAADWHCALWLPLTPLTPLTPQFDLSGEFCKRLL